MSATFSLSAIRRISAVLLLAFISTSAFAQDEEPQMIPAPDRQEGEGEGPFERLIIRGATLIDGTGAPPIGPVDIVIENNRIVEVESVGYPGLPIDEDERPDDATREIDAHNSWVMPGIVDMHTHTGGSTKAPEAEYSYKLWLGHGITTVRGVPSGSMEFSISEKGRSARNEIVAPRMFSYQRMGSGERYEDVQILTPDAAREWVRYAARQGADGLKLGAYRPAIMQALIDEAKEQGLGTTAHLGQLGVAQMNAQDAARLGLDTATHYYGLFESMYENNDVQPWPVDMNYNNEQHRFGQVARQWNLIAGRGSDKWNALLEEFKALDFTLDPTFTIYSAGRDVMRARNADWHDIYTLPTQWDFYTPNRESHGAYWFDWTTADEVAWKNFYRIWMRPRHRRLRLRIHLSAVRFRHDPRDGIVSGSRISSAGGDSFGDHVRRAGAAQSKRRGDCFRRRSPRPARGPGHRRRKSNRQHEGAVRHRCGAPER